MRAQVGGWIEPISLDLEERARHAPLMMLKSHELAQPAHIVYGFTTRSDMAGRRLHLGTGVAQADWARAAEDLGVAGWPTAYVSQVHGDQALWAETDGCVGEADAVFTREPELLVAVRTADCVPVLVWGESVVGAIHAGWRGLAAGIIPKALQMLSKEGPLHAVVGPSICMDCYEVGEEVVQGIARWTEPKLFVRRGLGKPHVDGGAAAVAQLRRAGVAHVERLAECSRCDTRLWSHRRDGAQAGRQAGLVGRRC